MILLVVVLAVVSDVCVRARLAQAMGDGRGSIIVGGGSSTLSSDSKSSSVIDINAWREQAGREGGVG